uniref:phytol kinase n=1 Tax=Eptatretus burgeri TaxID=7764 RepID=A0A8C4N9N5_EPTBU
MLLFFGQAAKDPTYRDPSSVLVSPKLRLLDTEDEPSWDQTEMGKKSAVQALLKWRAERLVKLDVTDPQYLEVYTDNRTTSREAYSLLIPAMQHSTTGSTIQLLDLREEPPSPIPVVWCNNVGCGERRRTGLSLHLCAACRLAYYCCRACQREDWKQGHKQRCFEREGAHACGVIPQMPVKPPEPAEYFF